MSQMEGYMKLWNRFRINEKKDGSWELEQFCEHQDCSRKRVGFEWHVIPRISEEDASWIDDSEKWMRGEITEEEWKMKHPKKENDDV